MIEATRRATGVGRGFPGGRPPVVPAYRNRVEMAPWGGMRLVPLVGGGVGREIRASDLVLLREDEVRAITPDSLVSAEVRPNVPLGWYRSMSTEQLLVIAGSLGIADPLSPANYGKSGAAQLGSVFLRLNSEIVRANSVKDLLLANIPILAIVREYGVGQVAREVEASAHLVADSVWQNIPYELLAEVRLDVLPEREIALDEGASQPLRTFLAARLERLIEERKPAKLSFDEAASECLLAKGQRLADLVALFPKLGSAEWQGLRRLSFFLRGASCDSIGDLSFTQLSLHLLPSEELRKVFARDDLRNLITDSQLVKLSRRSVSAFDLSEIEGAIKLLESRNLKLLPGLDAQFTAIYQALINTALDELERHERRMTPALQKELMAYAQADTDNSDRAILALVRKVAAKDKLLLLRQLTAGYRLTATRPSLGLLDQLNKRGEKLAVAAFFGQFGQSHYLSFATSAEEQLFVTSLFVATAEERATIVDYSRKVRS